MINELCVQPGVRHCCLKASKSRPTCFALTARCGLWPRLWKVPQYKNACKRHSTSWYTRTHTHTHYIHSIASFTQSWTHFSCYRENHQRLPYLTEILPYFFQVLKTFSAHAHAHANTHLLSCKRYSRSCTHPGIKETIRDCHQTNFNKVNTARTITSFISPVQGVEDFSPPLVARLLMKKMFFVVDRSGQ